MRGKCTQRRAACVSHEERDRNADEEHMHGDAEPDPEWIPRGRPGDADDVARLVAGLFAMNLNFLSGETIYIDGALGIAH